MAPLDAGLHALWHQIRELDNRVARGEPLELTADVRDLLVRSAPTVAISDAEAEAAIADVVSATALLREIRKRIRVGSDRLGDAQLAVYDLQDAGDFDGAREQMEDVLAVEVVPSYRDQAENSLKELTRVAAVAATGHVEAALDDWVQLPILLHRVQQGNALELNDGMRAFLYRIASSVAMSEAEAGEALTSPMRAGALLGKIMGQINQGSERLQGALVRMMRLRDAGNLAGARQQMRDVLEVEIIPRFRREAEELLAGLDEPLRAQ
jgi:DUSAM domain-containing protein